MAKIRTEQHTLRAILNWIDDRQDSEWWEMMGIEIPGMAEEIEAARMSEAYCHVNAIEDTYLRDHLDDLYEVIWPEHVSTPRFNGDATYRLIESSVKS
jgi:hypothetical protein